MKVWTNRVNESWILDRVVQEWIQNNSDISTNSIKHSDIIWISSNWTWKKIPKKYLSSKKVICSVYHIDFDKFDKKQEKNFNKLDKYVDEYHVISLNTKEQLASLTKKKITSIPFWINQDNWFHIEDKEKLRYELKFQHDDYLVGSFQRDTEGSDLISPKLIKGPDIFIDIVKKIKEDKPKLKIVLTGTRRQYVINKLNEAKIPFYYVEMADILLVNKLYNILDLYLVTSRIEGGPQAILECALTKTPILSTDVGVASEILDRKSIFKPEDFESASVNIDYAFENSQDYTIPKGMIKFRRMFENTYES